MADATERRIIDLQESATLVAGAFVAVDSATHGTRKYDLGTLVASMGGGGLVRDDDTGEYTNESVVAWLAARGDGLAYGVRIPKGSATACTKLGANAGMAAPTPGWVGHPAIDPYVGVGPFRHYDVNGYEDEDGTQHVTAFEGDGHFRRDGSNGDVWELAPVLWTREDEGEEAVERWVSDTRRSGMSAQPHAYLPDGSLRPYMLYAKYPGVRGDDGYMHSYSGFECWIRNVSHNSLITQCRNATTGYSGKSVADDWYVKTMFLLKYATKNSQSVFAGCSSYYLDYQPTVAETGVTRVIIAKASAANLVVGSSVSLGSARSSDSVLGSTRILRIEDYDESNSAVYLDVSATFDTTTDLHLSTMPWRAGCLDAVEGDGALTQAGLSNGKEPFKLQGIELAHGMTEILGDVIISNDGTSGWVPYVCHDSRYAATSLNDHYTSCGAALPTDSTDSWKYPTHAETHEGLMYGTDTGASTSTGLCDGHYTNKLETVGTREWLSLGYLVHGGFAGLWYVAGYGGLGSASWDIGSRLSGTGRSRG